MNRRRPSAALGVAIFVIATSAIFDAFASGSDSSRGMATDSNVSQDAESGFAPVDVGALPKVDGKRLLVASYLTFLVGIFLYAAFLVRRERIVESAIKDLTGAIVAQKGRENASSDRQ